MSPQSMFPIPALRSLLPIALLATLTGSACVVAAPVSCDLDAECDDGLVCARTGECADADQLLSVRLSWTLYGQEASEQTCGSLAVTSMEVIFEDQYTGDNRSYAPVACELGQVFFNRMPPRFSSVRVVVKNGGRRLDSVRVWLQSGETVAAIDFLP